MFPQIQRFSSRLETSVKEQRSKIKYQYLLSQHVEIVVELLGVLSLLIDLLLEFGDASQLLLTAPGKDQRSEIRNQRSKIKLQFRIYVIISSGMYSIGIEQETEVQITIANDSFISWYLQGMEVRWQRSKISSHLVAACLFLSRFRSSFFASWSSMPEMLQHLII